MTRPLNLLAHILFVLFVVVLTSHVTAQSTVTIQGTPLQFWVEQASAPEGPDDLDATVAALCEALENDDPNAKRDAADALAVLGPKAKAALETLLGQFGHEFPWVRVSCLGAVGAMGKEAVPALIETMKNNEGGMRIRAIFVLGNIGAEAKGAIPAILEVMEGESPAMQARIAGVLTQIDPKRFSPMSSSGKVRFEESGAQSNDDLKITDWPEFHGPRRDSICREQGLLKEWPEGGPKLLWTLNGLGRGYSTLAIANGKFFTMGDRPTSEEAEEQFVIAYDLETHDELWASPVGPPHSDGGPRCTPTVDGEVLYALGTDGNLVCLEVESGKERWRRSFAEDFQGKVMSVWKFSESPLVDSDRLICTPGGPEAMMVALDKHTGKVIWKCAVPELGEKGADGCGYSSAVVAEICGVRQYVQLIGRGVIGVEAATGKFLWGYNAVANNVANITSPVVRGDYVFASTAYNTGSALLKIIPAGDAFHAEEVYFASSRDFQNHHGGIVLLGDYIYGGHGPNRGDPRCLELGSGKIVWKERAPAAGSAAVLYADGHLIFRYDRGPVYLIEATPDEFRVKGHFDPIKGEGPAWAHPVIHNGRLYLRHADVLACYDLRAKL